MSDMTSDIENFGKRIASEIFATQLEAIDQVTLKKMLDQVIDIYNEHMLNFDEYGWKSEAEARQEAISMTLASVYSWAE